MSIDSFPQKGFGKWWSRRGRIACLQCSSTKSADDHPVCIPEADHLIWHTILLTEGFHKLGNLPQIVSRKSGEQMMLNLELKTAMKPIHVRWGRKIQCSSGLHLHPCFALGLSLKNGRREMVQAELHMLNASDCKAEEHKEDSFSWAGQIWKKSTEPDIEERNASNL